MSRHQGRQFKIHVMVNLLIAAALATELSSSVCLGWQVEGARDCKPNGFKAYFPMMLKVNCNVVYCTAWGCTRLAPGACSRRVKGMYIDGSYLTINVA